jgi:hypothetical protein
LEAAAAYRTAKPGSNLRKMGDPYASCMGTATIDARGLAPLQADFRQISRPMLRRGDAFLEKPMAQALKERERRGRKILKLDEAVSAVVEKLKGARSHQPVPETVRCLAGELDPVLKSDLVRLRRGAGQDHRERGEVQRRPREAGGRREDWRWDGGVGIVPIGSRVKSSAQAKLDRFTVRRVPVASEVVALGRAGRGKYGNDHRRISHAAELLEDDGKRPLA